MLGSFRQYLFNDDTAVPTTTDRTTISALPRRGVDDTHNAAASSSASSGHRAFNAIRIRASNLNLALPSIAGIRDFTLGSSSSSTTSSININNNNVATTTSAPAPGTSSASHADVSSIPHSRGRANASSQLATRVRSRSLPPSPSSKVAPTNTVVPSQSLRKRAIQMKDSAISDLRMRANLARLPSFHFSMPFSDSSPAATTALETSNMDLSVYDGRLQQQKDTDTSSLTSLEVEALQTDMKAENNRLRGIIEGLPKFGLPRPSNEEPFAGLSPETKDLNIVVLGGYRGSVLRSSEDGRMLWVPMKVGLGIRKVDLELPLSQDAEREASRSIRADGMLTHIGPVDISRRLLSKLRNMQERGFCRVHEYGYDWRLGGEYLSDNLIAYVESLAQTGNTGDEHDNHHHHKVLVIAHSLGGLITLHALNRRPDLFRGVLFAGTPFHGCPNILGPFRYGDGVLLNKSILNARTNFSMRSSFLLLPTHKRCFVDIESGKELPIDLFDTQAWRTYGFSPMVADDHGDGDVGEATDVNGAMATGGIGGPSMGNAADDFPSSASRTGGGETAGYRQAAIQYLHNVLASTLTFRRGLVYDPATSYPPMALLRASSTQTVRGCSVDGVEGIKAGDYSRFIFSPGDGVVTFASADLGTLYPLDTNADDVVDGKQGYKTHIVQDIENDRGHIGLLGDLPGVARCIEAILAAPAPRRPATPSEYDQQPVTRTVSSGDEVAPPIDGRSSAAT